MNHLFIVAHPDDEILGSAGTIINLKKNSEYVAVAVFSTKSATRENGLLEKCKKIHKKIGVDKSYFLNYEMMKFGTYDRHEMTVAIENLIVKEKPDIIYTHDYNDIHNDHRTLHKIVMEASKLPMRGISDVHPIRAIYTMEIPSSSDWGSGFIPNSYVEITEEHLRKKEEALIQYNNVLRELPHPVNYDSFKALARYRGGQCGCLYAESYKKVFEINRM